MRAGQLFALLNITYGAGQEAFGSLNETLRDDILWLAASLAGELKHLIPLIAVDEKQKGGT
jgi:hypothetical protein